MIGDGAKRALERGGEALRSVAKRTKEVAAEIPCEALLQMTASDAMNMCGNDRIDRYSKDKKKERMAYGKSVFVVRALDERFLAVEAGV